MIESANSTTDVPLETAIPGAQASLDSILRTEELHKRPRRSTDREKETAALAALVRALADSPGTILQPFDGFLRKQDRLIVCTT
jgi:hypothetical protein